MARTFELTKAVRKNLPIMIGCFGPSHSGKTFSMLRIATGMQRVRGGRIAVIDTESRRALHYADDFDFDHMPFTAPFAPLDYLEACRAAIAKGARILVIDSGSHMHEGPGGLLEQHAAIVKQMAGDDWKKAQAVSMAAWVKPKQGFQRFKNELLQLDCAILICLRAKQKLRPAPKGAEKKDPIELGWMPIINDELTFELLINPLLEPSCDGEPTWEPSQPESRARVKLPKQFREYFLKKQGPLDEADGEMLAQWAAGAAAAKPAAAPARPPATFGKRLAWDGQPRWAGKPLATAPLETLREYRETLQVALEGTRGDRDRKLLGEHMRDVDSAMQAKEPPDPPGAP